jgi:predicted HD phosphohydrolase
MKNNPEQIVEEIFTLFDQQGGNEYIGEPVTILEHSLQAGQLAIDAKEEP